MQLWWGCSWKSDESPQIAILGHTGQYDGLVSDMISTVWRPKAPAVHIGLLVGRVARAYTLCILGLGSE